MECFLLAEAKTIFATLGMSMHALSPVLRRILVRLQQSEQGVTCAGVNPGL